MRLQTPSFFVFPGAFAKRECSTELAGAANSEGQVLVTLAFCLQFLHLRYFRGFAVAFFARTFTPCSTEGAAG